MDSFILELDSPSVIGTIVGIVNLVIIFIKIFLFTYVFYTLIKVNKYINRKNEEEYYKTKK